MSNPKKSGFRKIFIAGSAVILVVTAAFVFCLHRPAKIFPHAAEAPQDATPQTAASIATPQSAIVDPSTLLADADQSAKSNFTSLPSLPPSPSQLPATFTANVAENSLARSAETSSAVLTALTELSPRERTIFEKIPAPRFREDIIGLAPEYRTRALKALAAKPIPDADFASVHITSKGVLYYVCQLIPSDPRPGTPEEISTPPETTTAAAPVPITQPPVRHSRPGARSVLFLDFGGMDIANTAWNEMKDPGPVAVYRAQPYDIDGTPTTFSDQEQKNIIQIWENVAEDFAPFDVDVTTEKPATFDRTTGRALITHGTDSTGRTLPSIDKGAAGVALLNTFGEPTYHTDYSPALIYYNKLPTPADIAYAISHELGHNLGLSHDGPGTTLGDDDDNGYYRGHGYGDTSWTPIMGNGFGKKMIQWSKGEYYSANNHEDDLAIIEGKLGYRGNFAANSTASALSLAPFDDGFLGATGILRNAGDAHYYSVNLSSAGTINFALDPRRLSDTGSIIGNTDLKLEILHSSGNLLDSNNPASVTTASLSRNLTAGQWYVRVSSTGAGNPLSSSPTGYTAYGSIGQYTLVTDLVRSRPTLAKALNSDLTWLTESGSTAWFGQATTSHDQIGAAQSGPISPGQSTSIVTTVEGTGTLSFWWKISALTTDELTFFATDDPSGIPLTILAPISGQQDWQQRTYAINTNGTHYLGWIFERGTAPSAFATAWIDQVTWTPTGFTFNITPASRETVPVAGLLVIGVETSKPWTAATDSAWLTLSATTGNGSAAFIAIHEANDTLHPRSGIITITSGGINRTCEIVQPVLIPFATALGTDLTWQTGGNTPWTTQTITTHDGQHAARSGIIFGSGTPTAGREQQTWLSATVNGPGTVSFWWKVSSEEESSDETGPWGDILHFQIDGAERIRTSGEKDWKQRTLSITGAGAHELKWIYKKDPYSSGGADAAWLDQVTWSTGTAATLNISPDSRQTATARGQFPIAVDSNVAWNATSSATWLTITPASGTGSGNINITHAINTATTSRTGIITVTAGALTDTCTVTQAAAAAITTGTNNNNNSGSGGGGGGGALSLWSLAAIAALFFLRKTRK